MWAYLHRPKFYEDARPLHVMPRSVYIELYTDINDIGYIQLILQMTTFLSASEASVVSLSLHPPRSTSTFLHPTLCLSPSLSSLNLIYFIFHLRDIAGPRGNTTGRSMCSTTYSAATLPVSADNAYLSICQVLFQVKDQVGFQEINSKKGEEKKEKRQVSLIRRWRYEMKKKLICWRAIAFSFSLPFIVQTEREVYVLWIAVCLKMSPWNMR